MDPRSGEDSAGSGLADAKAIPERKSRLVTKSLHLERESNDKNCWPCVADPRNKLLSAAGLDDGRFLVGVFGWITQASWDQCVQFVTSNRGYLDKKVCLIGCIGPGRENVSVIKGMVWVDNKAVCREAAFGWDNAGFWYAYLTSNWRPCCPPKLPMMPGNAHSRGAYSSND